MMALIEELKASVQDALDRGFFILACEPHDKGPWAKYSPHAVNSATRNPELVFKPYVNGEEANYGVACGKSNLTVVDCDKGIKTLEQFYAWKKEHNIPDTFTVLSGRDGDLGIHMYFTRAVPTTKFDIGGISGDLKGIGGYVVGPGSLHPSGKKYTILHDDPLVELPPGFGQIAENKPKKDWDAVKNAEGKIPAGNRRDFLMTQVGKLRNLGMSNESAIVNALRDICVERCEDGENYPEEKFHEIAHAAVTKFDAQIEGHVLLGNMKSEEEIILPEPKAPLEGDWIGEMAHLVTDGTFIPLEFARAQIKTIVSESLDGYVGFTSHSDLHMKQWTMIISPSPESGKGESWKRTGELSMYMYLLKTGMKLPKSGYFSSGEHMVAYLNDDEFRNQHNIVYFDEMSHLFSKGTQSGSTLVTKLLSLYDRSEAAAGSLSHKGGDFENTSLSMTGCFTKSSFEDSMAGKGTGGSGFLSRCVIVYADRQDQKGNWPDLPTVKINDLCQKMVARWGEIYSEWTKQTQGEDKSWRWVPEESPAAALAREKIQEKLRELRKAQRVDADYVGRLESHFKRDLLLRAIFSGDGKHITEEMVKLSAEWVMHQHYLRVQLWEVDKGNQIERMEQKIRLFLERKKKEGRGGTRMNLMTACHVFRAGSGGADTFNRAFSAMLKSSIIEVVGKTHKGTDVFQLVEE
jgi:hypothetical protein